MITTSCNQSNDKKKVKDDYKLYHGARLGNWLDDITGKWKTTKGIFTFFRNGELIYLSFKDGQEYYGNWEYNYYNIDHNPANTFTLNYQGSKELFKIESINSDSIISTEAFSNDQNNYKTYFIKIHPIVLDITNDIIRYDGVYLSKNDTIYTYLRFFGNGLITGCKLKRQPSGKNIIPELFRENFSIEDRKSFSIQRNIEGYEFHRRGGILRNWDTLVFKGEIIDANRILINTFRVQGIKLKVDSFVFLKSDSFSAVQDKFNN